MSGRCTLVGKVPYESLSGYLSLADVAVEPKRAASGEASGKLLNYMAAGLAVVCYDTANNREMLAEAGFYGCQDDEASLLPQLRQVLTSPEERSRRGKLAKSLIINKYSWDAAAEKIADIYQKIL